MTTSRVVEEPLIDKPNLENGNSIIKEEFVDNLVIYYFDHKKGPTMFYSSNNANFGYLDPKRFLDVVESGTFILAIQNYQTINHIFTIQSEYARGRQETLMISYIVKHLEIEDIFRHLRSKTLVLEEFVEELKKLEELPSLLHNLDDSSFLYDLEYEDFNGKFLNIYNEFYIKLSLKFKILQPINELKPENIDTFSIKLYIKPDDLAYIINEILFNKKLAFTVVKEQEISRKIKDFFSYVYYDTFKPRIIIKNKKFYTKNKERVVLEKKTYKKNKYKIIKEIIKNFYEYKDSISAIIYLRDKIRELYVLTKRICEYYEDKGNPEVLYKRNIVKDLETMFYVKINKDYFLLLDQIVKNYHGIEIVWVQEFIADKLEEMWKPS